MNALDILLAGSLLFNLLLFIRIRNLKRDVRRVKESAEFSKEELEQLKARIEKIKRLG